MAEDWRDVAAVFNEFGCATYKLSIKGMVLRFCMRSRKELGLKTYYRRADDPQGRRWPSEAAAAKAVV